MIHLCSSRVLAAPRALIGATLGVAVSVSLASLGCSGTDKPTITGVKSPATFRVEIVKHEPCDPGSYRVDALDSNNDGKTDIQRMYDKKTGAEACRVVDLNHDGKADLYEYFEANGTIRRREYAYDDTGAINAVEYYEGGKLVRREYDTTGQHRIDTWDFFDPAKPVSAKTGRPVPVRRERDTNGDGHIDQWWVWDGDKITISMDKTGDGKPDPENTIVLNDTDAGVVAAPPPAPPPSPSDGTSSSGSSASPPDSGSPPAAGSAATPPATATGAGVATSPADAGTKKDGGKP